MKKLDIIVGDDAFNDFFVKNIFTTDYVNMLKEGLKDYDINVQIETDPQKVMEKAHQFDVVVTDLDYTGCARGEEGYEVVDAVSQMKPKPLLILCTSSDDYDEIKARTEGKIDYYAKPDRCHKFDSLVQIIVQHYKK